MLNYIRFVAVVGSALLWIAPTALVAAPQDDLAGRRYTVEASVQQGSGAYIRAELVPGPFTVPKGYRATNLKVRAGDPQTNYETDKLRPSHIRAVRGGYVGPDIGEAGFSLGPGDFVFVIGGFPGARGTLSYTLERTEGVDDNASAGERIIDIVTWSPKTPEYKLTATYYVRDGKVRAESDYVYEYPKNEHWNSEPLRIKGVFVGTMTGNVITGTWENTTLPHRLRFAGSGSNPAYDRVDSGKASYETRVVLYSDGTLTETLKGSGTTEMNWGPTAPKDVAGKRETAPYEFTIPGEFHTQPITGAWKNRK